MMDGINSPWITTGYGQWHWAPNTRVFMVPWSVFHPANRAQSHTQFIAAVSAPPTESREERCRRMADELRDAVLRTFEPLLIIAAAPLVFLAAPLRIAERGRHHRPFWNRNRC